MGSVTGRMMRKYDALERRIAYVSTTIVVLMMLLTTADVILRYVFNAPIQDSFELSQFMMVGIVFLGVPYLQTIKGHVSVEFLTSRVSPTSRKILTIFGYIMGLFAYALITWRSGYYAWKAWETSDYKMGIIHYPLWPAKSMVPLGCAMLCIMLILDILHDSAELLSGKPRL